MMKFSRSILLLLLPILVVSVFSTSKKPDDYDIKSISYFDTNSDEIDGDEQYKLFTNTDQVNIRSKYIWVRVDGNRFESKKHLKFLNKLIPYIEQYKRIGNELVLVDSSGFNIPCEKRNICHQDFILNIYPEYNYYRIHNQNIITNLRVNILDQSEFIETNLKEQIGYGIYYGIFFFFILLNTFLFLQLKDRTFLFNISFTILLGVSFAIYDGSISSSLLSGISVNTLALSRILFNLLLINHLLFSFSFFKISKRHIAWKWLYYLMYSVQGTLLLLSFLPIESFELQLNYITLGNFYFQVVIIFVLLGKSLFYTNDITKKYLISYLPIVVLVITYPLKVTGYTLFKYNYNDILYTCLAALLLFLAMYIIDAFASYKEDAEKRLKDMKKLKNDNNLNLEKKINFETQYLQKQQKQLSIKNKELLDSFHYAKRIQNSLLTNEATIQRVFPESYLFFEPKQILSNDFYWVTHISTKNNPSLVLFCIGQPEQSGIPGTLINALILKTIRNSIHSQKLNNTAKVINYIQHRLDPVLAKNGVNTKHSLLVGIYNKTNQQLSFSGNIELIEIIRNGKPLDKGSIQGNTEEYINNYSAHEHTTVVNKTDQIYLFTGGIEQLINQKGKHYFLQLLMRISTHSTEDQKHILQKESQGLKQQKDLTLIGFRI